MFFSDGVESSGWCLNLQGLDQNSGVEYLERGLSKLECWDICKRKVGVTACEFKSDENDANNSVCTVHKEGVSRGNGYSNHVCLVL